MSPPLWQGTAPKGKRWLLTSHPLQPFQPVQVQVLTKSPSSLSTLLLRSLGLASSSFLLGFALTTNLIIQFRYHICQINFLFQVF